MSSVSAVVLAAGSSSRMGAIKPLVEVRGRPMLAWVLSTLEEAAVDEILVVLGYSASAIQQSVDLGRARFVLNEAYGEGISSSLRVGVNNVAPEAEAAVIVLADQPFLMAGTIDRLIDEYRHNRAKIVIPTHDGARGNPVLLDRSLFREAASLSGDVGFRALFAQHAQEILKVPVEDPGVLIDLDTTADLEKWVNR